MTTGQIGTLQGGGTLLHQYNSSTLNMLQTLFPEHRWLPWRFHYPPRGYWEDLKNQRSAMDWLAAELNIQQMEDWYSVTIKQLCDSGGATMLKNFFDGSPARMIQTLYPEHEWFPWKFHRTRKEWLANKQLLNMLARQLQIVKWEDWYDVTKQQLQVTKCDHVLEPFANSLSTMLMSLLPHPTNPPYTDIANSTSRAPHSQWLPWKFKTGPPPKFWRHKPNLRQYFDWLITCHNLSGPLELISRPVTFFQENYAPSFLLNEEDLLDTVQDVYSGKYSMFLVATISYFFLQKLTFQWLFLLSLHRLAKRHYEPHFNNSFQTTPCFTTTSTLVCCIALLGGTWSSIFTTVTFWWHLSTKGNNTTSIHQQHRRKYDEHVMQKREQHVRSTISPLFLFLSGGTGEQLA